VVIYHVLRGSCGALITYLGVLGYLNRLGIGIWGRVGRGESCE